MLLMGSRYLHLNLIGEGYKQCGIPLVEYDGTQFLPPLISDDIGIYIVIPKLAALFNLSIDYAINLFFYGFIVLGTLLGIWGFWLYCQTFISRFISITGILLLSYTTIRIGDVYVSSAVCIMGLLPLYLYFITKNKFTFLFNVFLFCAGILINTANYIRAYAGIGMLLFIGILLLHASIHWHKKLFLLLSLSFGFVIPQLYVQHICNQYQTFAQTHFPHAQSIQKVHPFWHTVYCGFGFLKFLNVNDISYNDTCAADRVASIDPSFKNRKQPYYDPQYKQILKEEVFKLFKQQRFFVIATLFAKLGVLFFFLFKYANIGLLAALFYPKPWLFELAFFSLIAFNSIFPLIADPRDCYSLGFIASATLYGIISIIYALENGLIKRLLLLLRIQKFVKV